jgi:hypothetical protein
VNRDEVRLVVHHDRGPTIPLVEQVAIDVLAIMEDGLRGTLAANIDNPGMACPLRTGGDLISAHGQVREKQRSLGNRVQEGITLHVLDLQIDIRQILATVGGKGEHNVVVVGGHFHRLGLLFADTARHVMDTVLCLDFRHYGMGGQNNAHRPQTQG